MISEYLNGCEEIGLSTARLYLKTWMSLINKETNTSRGEVVAA